MKTTLHYLLTILLLSLATVHARAATGDEGPFKITDVNGVTLQYNADTTLLTISGGGSLTITGDGKPVNCGIVIEPTELVTMTMKDVYLQSEIPLKGGGDPDGENLKIILQGINKLESTATNAQPGMLLTGNIDIFGNGSLTSKGSDSGGAGIDTYNGKLLITENAFIIAIGGKGAQTGVTNFNNYVDDMSGQNSLLISGVEQSDNNIKQNYSKLIGNFTLGVNAEIPEWASVNVARDQTLTIANNVTLTNSGTIINNGTINGTPAGNPVNTIGGKDGFTIEPDQYVGLEYDSGKKLLTIRGFGELTITGQGKPVNCGIVIAEPTTVTMKDLYLQSEIPLTTEMDPNGIFSKIILQGINRLESNAAGKQPSMLLKEHVNISGPGSLTVKGSESGGVGIDYRKLTFENEAFVVAIGGKGAVGAKNGSIYGDNGLLISGSLQNNGSIKQDDSKLIGNFTLNTNIEIPDWATVTIPANQSITIKENVTLTNQGTLTLEDKGTLTNNGTISLGEKAVLDTKNGNFENNGKINLGGVDGFDITDVDPTVSWDYSKTNKLLTLDGTGKITIAGKGKPVDCGIVIESKAGIERLTLHDVSIQTKYPFKAVGDENSKDLTISLQGKNSLESTASGSGSQPSMALGRDVKITGGGSLTAKGSSNGGNGIEGSYSLIIEDAVLRAEGGADAWGISCVSNKLTIDGNAFVIAIGGNSKSSGISQPIIKHVNGLLICGVLDTNGSFLQDNSISELKGSIKLHVDAEIPTGASITVNEGEEFTISDNVTLTNNGTLSNRGTIEIKEKGQIKGNPPEHFVKFDPNYNTPQEAGERYIKHGSEPIIEDFIDREGYTFEGWYDAPDGGRKVTAVTNPMRVYAHWIDKNAKPEPEPEPDPVPPPYVPVYYDVSLPAVEGAVTDPVAGVYSVEAWDTFRFYLTLDTAYNKSEPVVTTSRNEIIKPRTSDGAYLVKYVRSDLEIYIDGIVRNNAVANDPIRPSAPEPEVWAERSYLCIRLAEGMPGAPVYVFTPSGRLMETFRSTPGLNRRQLPTGVYIVRVGDMVRKVMVR